MRRSAEGLSSQESRLRGGGRSEPGRAGRAGSRSRGFAGGATNVVVACLFGALCSAGAEGTTVPFTEDFAADAAGWYDAAGTSPLSWVAAGGPDGGSFASTTFTFVNSAADDTAIQFRAQDEFGSSGGALEGNWIEDGVAGFSAFVRHDAGVPLAFFTRFSGPGNFPGAVAVSFAPVPANTWTPIAFAIDPASPQFVSFEGTDFDIVFSNVGHVQVGVSVPEELAGVDQSFTFDIDKPAIVPEPTALGFLGAGGVLMLLRRCRRAARTATFFPNHKFRERLLMGRRAAEAEA